jgi:hypothetical protein
VLDSLGLRERSRVLRGWETNLGKGDCKVDLLEHFFGFDLPFSQYRERKILLLNLMEELFLAN